LFPSFINQTEPPAVVEEVKANEAAEPIEEVKPAVVA
jgi:hypothetical protein